MHLTPPDEYFNHQVALPHAVVGSSDPHWRERYWISLQDVARQDFILTAGFGKYPNQDVMEGFVIVQHGTRQHNLRVSRQLAPRNDAIEIGPLSIEVIEPLKTLRLRLAHNPSGMTADITWHASMPSMLEGRHFEIHRGRVSHDLVRYVQLGRASGSLRLPEADFALTRDSCWGERDHSWGVRPMAHLPGEPPPASPAWNFLAFCPLQFPSFAVHFYLFEAQAGRPTHLSASIVRREGQQDAATSGDDEISGVEHVFEWVEGAAVRTLASGRITLGFFSGRTLAIDLRALAPRVYLKGGGYGVDHGRWKDESHLEHESWDLDAADRLRDYAASSSDHMVEARCNGETGFGVIEYIVRRGHSLYGRRG